MNCAEFKKKKKKILVDIVRKNNLFSAAAKGFISKRNSEFNTFETEDSFGSRFLHPRKTNIFLAG